MEMETFSRSNNSLEGLTITAGVVIKGETRGSDQELLHVSGYIRHVWEELGRSLHFKTEYYRPENGSWGVQNSDGTWNGMIGELTAGRIEVGISDFVMNPQRLEAVDFLPPLIQTEQVAYKFLYLVFPCVLFPCDINIVFCYSNCVFIRKGYENDFSWNLYTAPFTNKLWLALVAAMLVLALSSYVSWAFTRHKMGRTSWRELLLGVVASFLNQGYPMQYGLYNIIHVTAHMTATVLTAAYAGGLISFLAVQRPMLPFQSFQGLLGDGTYRLGVLENSAQLNLLDRTEDPLMKEIYSRLVLPGLSNSPGNLSAGLQRVCEDHKYAFLVEKANALGTLGSLPCEVVAVPRTLIPATISVIIPKNATYRCLLSRYVNQMRRTGILRRIWNRNFPPEETRAVSSLRSPGFETIAPLIVILAAGLTIACLLLLLERVIHKQN